MNWSKQTLFIIDDFYIFEKNLGKWATENWEKKKTACCGHIVEEKYCPNCGQQNIKTRQQFHYLFTHFIEDFTHYDGQFWGTLKNLVFKPGKLTNTYPEGKIYDAMALLDLLLAVYCSYSFSAFMFLIIGLGKHQFSDDPLKQKAKFLKKPDFFKLNIV